MEQNSIHITLQFLGGLDINWTMCIVAALSTLAIGYLWYHPRVFGNIWMEEADITTERMAGMNTGLAFGGAVVLSFFSALLMYVIVNADPPSSSASILVGVILWAFMVMPILVITSLLDNKSWRYILVNGGYWLLCFSLMGSIVALWG